MELLLARVRLLQNPVHHFLPTVALDFGHRVVVEVVLAHPLESVGSGPAATQSDLDIVLPSNPPVVNEPTNGLRVSDEMSVSQVAGIVVRIEMDDADPALAVNVAQPDDVGIFK